MDIVEHYTASREELRLSRTPHGRLEFLRTQELIRRHLPAPTTVLDVGGGTGIHAEWLAADGHTVHVIDVVPTHVQAAAQLPGVTASVGDARQLSTPDSSVDVVLLLGPLYHLVSPADRAQALAEARRILRPGGLLIAAAISRYLTLMETGSAGTLHPGLADSLSAVMASGRYDGHAGFLPTHWHTASELHDELTAAGLPDVEVYGIEGPTWTALDAAGIDSFDTLAPAALAAARLVEQDPLLINASAHFLAVATSNTGGTHRDDR
ncbi:class I SAM-dependent methyltransferase [Kutzneria chonburiensis]|uniref:Class I SAM-dependent methyltransferase n=1 Tax=Kutzneria chonburiensis TaxID=1483604 RepID=A0ABV6MMI6_9PSEU|nr:class I SAM-dependent methyltransferase [Kutzneria chonburiensis]